MGREKRRKKGKWKNGRGREEGGEIISSISSGDFRQQQQTKNANNRKIERNKIMS